MNYKQLLLKYINHVGVSEGTTFLGDHDRDAWTDSVKFTDEEWAALQELDKVNFEKEFVTHSCSCHVRNAGPCDVCKVLGCEVWDFNRVATEPYEFGIDHATLYIAPGVEMVAKPLGYLGYCTVKAFCQAEAHARDCPKWEE